ncbi:hypothetical protein GQ53DRAFT_753214 [Thozetella sp. PMI_491]|nr:hypothetical protein GQ53DRAFT_753214 [Thozetella sp. PMI_491]
MSDDDYSGYGQQANTTLGSATKQRSPRFAWNLQYEDTFFRSLCESVSQGLREGSTFKAEAWDRAIRAIINKHNAFPTKSHLINKSDNARKKFRLWRGLREDPEFRYNEQTRIVTASEEAWKRRMEKDPQCRSLKGRAFDHEQYFQVLYPDVIGSGGAPKRVTKARRKAAENNAMAEELQPTGAGMMDMLADATYGQVPQQSMAGPSNPAPAPTMMTHPVHSMLPPGAALPSNTALTPPEETAPNTRKRFMPADNANATTTNAVANANKRRRAASGVEIAEGSGQGSAGPAADSLIALADVLRGVKSRPTWAEQALDIFFRDFADEDMDLQMKIAEKALADENKAMVFCKMPVVLRKHWVKRLREVHNRNN